MQKLIILYVRGFGSSGGLKIWVYFFFCADLFTFFSSWNAKGVFISHVDVFLDPFVPLFTLYRIKVALMKKIAHCAISISLMYLTNHFCTIFPTFSLTAPNMSHTQPREATDKAAFQVHANELLEFLILNYKYIYEKAILQSVKTIMFYSITWNM